MFSGCASYNVKLLFLPPQSEEITLTIGQAFDLAYKNFLETSKQEGGLKKQAVLLQDHVTQLEEENSSLKKILSDALLIQDPVKLQTFLSSKRVNFLNLNR